MNELIILFGTHFISDFVLQTRSMGKKKSEDVSILALHFLVILISFFIVGIFIFREWVVPGEQALILAGAIAGIHSLQDWLIWRGYKNIVKVQLVNELDNKCGLVNVRAKVTEWKYWEDKWFYDTIGLDQLLHYVTITLVYTWLIGV